MSRYCLDTSAYSHFRRGDPAVVEIVDRAEWIGMPTIALGELRTGFRLGNRRQRNEDELREFLASPVVEEVEVDGEVSRHYAEMVVELRHLGTPIPTNDVWIAATTARAGALLLTYDGHFESISRLGVIHLGAGQDERAAARRRIARLHGKLPEVSAPRRRRPGDD